MEYITWYFFSIAIICLFCLGWRTITDEGKILYFIRKQFDPRILQVHRIKFEEWNGLDAEEKKLWTPVKVPVHSNVVKYEYERPVYYEKPWWADPFVYCVVCMPSFWGTLIYILSAIFILPQMTVTLHWSIVVFLFIPVIISCSFINGFFWSLKSYLNVHT